MKYQLGDKVTIEFTIKAHTKSFPCAYILSPNGPDGKQSLFHSDEKSFSEASLDSYVRTHEHAEVTPDIGQLWSKTTVEQGIKREEFRVKILYADNTSILTEIVELGEFENRLGMRTKWREMHEAAYFSRFYHPYRAPPAAEAAQSRVDAAISAGRTR